MNEVRIDWRLEQELKSKAERENFSDASELVNFLLDDSLKRGISKSTSYVPSRGNLRPELKKGDLCRLAKRAKNKIHYGSKNATYVVITVDNTVRGSYSRWKKNKGLPQERRIDPSNGYCSIHVAWKKDGVWLKTSFHRKDLIKVNR